MLLVNFSVKCHKFAQKWSISYYQRILAAIFVTIATVKVKSISEFYTLSIALMNYLKETTEKQFLLFGPNRGGGPKQPFNARTPLFAI